MLLRAKGTLTRLVNHLADGRDAAGGGCSLGSLVTLRRGDSSGRRVTAILVEESERVLRHKPSHGD
jgi:hypothetical protein